MLTGSLKIEVVVVIQVAGRLWRVKRYSFTMHEIPLSSKTEVVVGRNNVNEGSLKGFKEFGAG
jgi:hypothetical protein